MEHFLLLLDVSPCVCSIIATVNATGFSNDFEACEVSLLPLQITTDDVDRDFGASGNRGLGDFVFLLLLLPL